MQISLESLFIALTLAMTFGIFSVYKKWLDLGGAVAASLLGILLWVVGGWATTGPMLVFFISGSLLGKLPQKGITDAKHSRPRDWVQVVSNGGIAGVAVLMYALFPSPAWQMIFWVSVAVSTADTWSSGLGQWAGGKVWDVVGFKPMTTGLSGGVSWVGTLAGLLGSLVVAAATKLFAGIGWQVAMLVAGTGFAGMLIDSVLGSLFQAVYRLPNGQITEDGQAAATLKIVKGYSWMTNDLVNLLSNLMVAFVVGCIAFLLERR